MLTHTILQEIKEGDKASAFIRGNGIPILVDIIQKEQAVSKLKALSLRTISHICQLPEASHMLIHNIGIDIFISILSNTFGNKEKASTGGPASEQYIEVGRYTLSIVSQLLSSMNTETINQVRGKVLDCIVNVMARSQIEELQSAALNELIKLPWADKLDATAFVKEHLSKSNYC
jgi:hypothetical protein